MPDWDSILAVSFVCVSSSMRAVDAPRRVSRCARTGRSTRCPVAGIRLERLDEGLRDRRLRDERVELDVGGITRVAYRDVNVVRAEEARGLEQAIVVDERHGPRLDVADIVDVPTFPRPRPAGARSAVSPSSPATSSARTRLTASSTSGTRSSATVSSPMTAGAPPDGSRPGDWRPVYDGSSPVELTTAFTPRDLGGRSDGLGGSSNIMPLIEVISSEKTTRRCHRRRSPATAAEVAAGIGALGLIPRSTGGSEWSQVEPVGLTNTERAQMDELREKYGKYQRERDGVGGGDAPHTEHALAQAQARMDAEFRAREPPTRPGRRRRGRSRPRGGRAQLEDQGLRRVPRDAGHQDRVQPPRDGAHVREVRGRGRAPRR